MNPTSIDIKDILESESSLGLTYGSNLFIGKQPASPKNVVTIFDTPGMPDELLLSGSENGNAYQYPSIQVRVRNKHYIDGWTLANNIKEKLHGRANETWNSTLYSAIFCTSGPALMEWDDNSNACFVVNFNIERRK